MKMFILLQNLFLVYFSSNIMSERIIVTVMGKALEDGGKASEELVDRCRVATKVMSERDVFMVIPTGGDPVLAGISEAQKMRELMIEMGIAEEKIQIEPKAKTTVENAIFVMEMIRGETQKGKIKLIIVTSDYHISFSAWCFRQVAAATKMNVEFETVSATGPAKSTEIWNRILTTNNWPMIMKRTLKNNGVKVGEDFNFESLENIKKETEK